ncbi:MAG: hypothetical protein ACFE8M_01140 [Candidatus Hermodarchaeota archaeon]
MLKSEKKSYKISGSIFGIMALAIGLPCLIIATILRIEVDPTFSLMSNYICDLGDEFYSSNNIFLIGFILRQIFLIPFYISFGILLQKKIYESYLIKGAMTASVISNLSLAFVLPFLVDPKNQFFCNMHGLLGFIYFSFGSLAFTLYGIIELSNPKISNYYSLISFITAFLQGLFLFFPMIYLIEWFFIASEFSWVLIHAVFLFKNEPSNMKHVVFFELDYLIHDHQNKSNLLRKRLKEKSNYMNLDYD